MGLCISHKTKTSQLREDIIMTTGKFYNSNHLPNPFPGFNNPISHSNAFRPQDTNKNLFGVTAGNNGVIIHVVLDESSSMISCHRQTIDAFNEWLEGQKKQEGECFLTLSKFNGSSVTYITENAPIQAVEPLTIKTYRPYGSTNLLDAIGDNIEKIDTKLSTQCEEKRPGVIVVIMTDGEENTSLKYNRSEIKSMVEDRESKNWVFMFLGANIDAFSEGSSLGFNKATTLQYSTSNMSETMAALSGATLRARAAYASGLSGSELYTSSAYTDDERRHANKTGAK